MKKNMLPIVIAAISAVSCMNAQVGIHTTSAPFSEVTAIKTALR